jgi:FKBP-type peptidyl-prolyl cis-trans isomerase SlyD
MTIQHDKVVTLHYHLTNREGEVIESSRGSEPLTYLHGAGTLLSSLEHALTGLDVGATKTVELAPADAYGEHDATKVETLPREVFDQVPDLEVGILLEGQGPNGQTFTVHIIDILAKIASSLMRIILWLARRSPLTSRCSPSGMRPLTN